MVFSLALINLLGIHSSRMVHLYRDRYWSTGVSSKHIELVKDMYDNNITSVEATYL